MAQRVKDEELQRLKRQIKEWNENRLDLFELSQPNEGAEFHGVMRFFFQDEGAKVATKCIRVSSTATTGDVLETLIEKFRPDMRMLSMPRYSLYEVHVNGEERKLQVEERPLYVQLNWGKDDREGRFLLKNENARTVPLHSGVYSENDQSVAQSPEGSGFKRKLSKREKKEKKKLDKEAKLRGKENETPQMKNGVAQKLYNELPETSFTRSISNPEAVMKRRRQMKLEKKLQQFKSRDGGPDTGGTLKIYGDSVKPDVPYKTLLLSTGDTVAYVVRETLEKYGLEKEDASSYCLVQVIVPPSGHEYHGSSTRSEEFILSDDDCPLAILMQHPPSQGTIMFQLRRRTEMPKKKKKRSSSGSRVEHGLSPDQRPPGPDRLPFLVELNPDGSESYQRGKVVLPLNVTEVGSDQCVNGHYLQLYGPDVLPKHCVLAHMEGIVTATPASQDADTYVNNQRIYETTVLQHGALLRFGKRHMFRFYDPGVLESGGPRPMSTEVPKRSAGPPPDVRMGQSAADISNFETTFDVDGHIETVTREEKPPLSPGPEDLLPAMLEFREEGEDAFLAAVVSEVNGAAVQYKLAPTYTLYMAIRYRIARVSHPNLHMAERAHWIASLVSKIANMVHQTIQESVDSPGALSFWMANASELLHFVKHDRQLQGAPHMMEAQDSLAEAVQLAFSHLVDCLQEELANAMPAFLEESLRDLDADDGDVLQVLSSAMSLLRQCRVNAALTIQLFSQLFHFINMWLFNTLVLEPRSGLCTRQWGHRWKRRLGRIEVWAEKQGLELAADCHLARIIQAAHLLEAPKSSADDIASISSACFKLNSLQLRALLENYIHGMGEPRIPQELIESVVGVAESTADEFSRSDGRQIRLEEEPDLQLPFLLPEDGYSCDIIRGVPSGLADFLDPLCKTGICRFVVRAGVSGMWTVYFIDKDSEENILGGVRDEGSPPKQQPDIINVTFSKVSGSMGLSIVAAKGEGQKDRGIYVKSVVAGGGAAKDGRLQAGDQLLEVDGRSLTGLTQEKAAEYMTRTGQTVTLKVAKQGAIYHGLATLLSQPSPVMQRAASSQKVRPHSDEMSRYPGRPDDYMRHPQQGPDARQRAINQQMAARSSPSLTGSQSSDRTHPVDRHHQPPGGYNQQDPSQMALRSKSTSNLDSPGQPRDYRQAASMTTLPRGQSQQAEHPDRSLSQPEFNTATMKANYKNYPQGRYDVSDAAQRSPHIPPQPTYVNQSEIRQQYAAYSKHGVSPPRQGNLDGRTAKSLSSLNHEEMQQRRTQQRPRPHELEQPGQMGAPYYKSGPRGEAHDTQPKPAKAAALQKPAGPEEGRSPTLNGCYEARPVHAPDMQRPSYQQRVADMSRPPHTGSPPRAMGGPPQQGRYPSSEGDTLRGRPEFQRDKQSPLTRLEKYDQTNQSPDLPPPPDMSPDLPPPPEGLPPYTDDLPPPPPHLSGDTGPPEQWHRGPGAPEFQQQQRNGPDSRLDQHGKPVQKPGTYPGPGGNYGTYQNQTQGGGTANRPQQPIKPQVDSRQPTKLKLPAGQLQPRRESDTRSQSSETQPKPKPPVAAKPRILSTDLSEPGPSPSPWEREQKEREIKRLEEEARQLRQQEIQELEALGDRLSSQGRDRLRRLRLDEEFDRRVREASTKDDDDPGVDSDTDMGERASGRAKMLRMMHEDMDRRQKQAEEEKQLKSVEDNQVNVDMMERQERRLQRFETECEEQRVRQMKRQEKRAQATEDYLLKQREMRERQRREMEEHQRQQRLEDEKQREKQREELRRKKELERSQLREMEERVMRDAARARDAESMHQQASGQSSGQRSEVRARDAESMHQQASSQSSGQRSEAELRHEFSQMKFVSSAGPQYGMEDTGPGPQYHGPNTDVQYIGQSTLPEPQYGGPRPQYGVKDSGPGPRYGAQGSGPRPQYASQPGAPGPQYTGQMGAPGPQYTGQMGAPGPQYTGQMGAPGPQYTGQMGAPGPQYTGQMGAPGPQYTGQMGSPGPQYTGQMGAPGPQYTGQMGAPGPQYTGQMNVQGQQYGGQVSAPGPQYRGPGPQYAGQTPGTKLKVQDPTQRPASAIYSKPPEKHVPSPPERWSSYDLYKDAGVSSYAGLPHEPVPAGIQQMAPPRSQSSSSVLRQPDQPGSGKKSVSFNDKLATEIHDYSRFDSTSSAEMSNFSPGPQQGYTNSYPAAPTQYSQVTPDKAQSELQDQRTPENTYDPRLVPGPTPGVVGAQEVYRDPRDRIAAAKAIPTKQPGPERMSFRDKMKMFAHEAGESTPKEKAKISRAQHWIEVSGQ